MALTELVAPAHSGDEIVFVCVFFLLLLLFFFSFQQISILLKETGKSTIFAISMPNWIIIS